MEDIFFTIDLDVIRLIYFIFLLSLPIIVSVIFTIKPKTRKNTKLRFVAKSSLLIYFSWFLAIAVVSIFSASLWYLEGVISENLFIFLSAPKGVFQSTLNYIILGIQLIVLFLIPFKLKSKQALNNE